MNNPQSTMLWKEDDAVVISFIVSKKRGSFRELVNNILALGLVVKVPTPLGRMKRILVKNGYQHTLEPFGGFDGIMVDVWRFPPQASI